jgi:RNA 3'-terminal phosphate cyclase (ATP)
MIELDGSFGEGGGQILRSSLALAVVTGQAFRLVKVRAGRPKPGLQPQHLTSVRAAAAVGRATVTGDRLGSRELTFEPTGVQAGSHRFDIGTAGATGLVLHTVCLPLAWRTVQPSTVTLIGGTHVTTSPCFHFLAVTWRSYLARIGLPISLAMERPGFYPRGGGVVEARIPPVERLNGLTLTKAVTPRRVVGFSTVAGLPEHVARRQARRATARLEAAGLEVEIRLEEWPGGPGSVLGLTFDDVPVPTFFFGLGARGKPAERVADEAVEQALAYHAAGAPVDSHSADQLVLPLALADGPSEFRVSEITRHLTTNIAVIQKFLPRRIECDGEEGATGVVRIAASDV